MGISSLRRLGKAALIGPAIACGLAAVPLGCESEVLDPFPSENAVLSCTSHGDCAQPATLCDRSSGRCVECRDSDDCDSGTCDRMTHTCRPSCSNDDDCTGRRRDRCDGTRGICVECVDDADCEVGLAFCDDDECIECMNDADCTNGEERHCEIARNRCRECLDDSHCGNDAHCDEDEMRCESNSR